MSENRIRVNIQPELTPTRLEDRRDLNAEINVAVDSHMTGLAVFGVVALVLGVLSALVGLVIFGVQYPSAAPREVIKQAVLFLGSGIVLLFLGTSSFFYGRTVLGSGRLDQFATKELEVMH
ncbi:MAG: hypothetical protein QOD77_1461 [Thermoplasmata archaeon]|jgi:hypothetical protein|nr:hypothetical protein [Thermoplasmata archaeon]